LIYFYKRYSSLACFFQIFYAHSVMLIKFIFTSLSVVLQANALTHPLNLTELLNVDEKILKEAISLIHAAEDEEVASETQEEKVRVIMDEVPKSINVNVSDQVETLFLDQINARIEEFEDLNTQVKVLERHLRKHSDFEEFNNTEHMLVDIEDKGIKPYEEELVVLKSKIINSNHEINATTVVLINTMVDNAEKFLEVNRERVYNALDGHVASEEHKHEHDVNGSHPHSPEHFADYIDLIDDDDEATAFIEEEETELLIEFIEMDIEEFKEVERQKLQYEKRITDQFSDDNIEPDELQLNIAEGVLNDMSIQDIKSFEDKLQSLKTQIKEANGRLEKEDIEKLSDTLDKAEAYLDSSAHKLKLVEALELEFEIYQKVESNIKPPKTNDVGNNNTIVSVESESEDSKSVEHLHKKLANEVPKHDQTVEDTLDKGVDESKQFEEKEIKLELLRSDFLSFNFSVSLVLLILVVVLVPLGIICRICRKNRVNKNGSCEVGNGDKSRLFSKKCTRSPKLDVVHENDEWSSKKWASKSNSRRKRM